MELLNREMQVLRFLLETRNITRAADLAGLQQPALSKVLHGLEEKMGRKLFARTSQGLVPSPFAIELGRLAESTQSAWDSSLNHLLEKENQVEGTFLIGSHSLIAQAYLSKVFSRLQTSFPLLDLKIFLDTSKVVSQKVVKGDLHFGIVANPVKNPELVSRMITSENVHLYGHGELEKSSVVYYNPEMIDVQTLTRSFRKYKLVSVADYHLILSFLLAHKGQGAILPSSLGVGSPALKILSRSLYKADIKLIYREDLYKSFASKTILDHLKEI